ncbi:hypothetical protein AU197_21130 [Mycobacterium sp. IS-1590]|uniref:hypothetical protein n=1 Tax=Mycobacterium sp. IS-1590 TaxID=1772286 RepID=UPI0007462DD1|nr:hypothetical protein [Mycobacterium sp. IS-1590]KUI43910.1 hypothetical protein AU197_21130 [Mycobacterium sp. IS-1590]
MLPLAQEVRVHTYSKGPLDAYGTAEAVYTPPLDQPGAPQRVYGWQVPESTERRALGGHAEMVITDVDLYAPPDFQIAPTDVVDLPGAGQFHVIGHPIDYTHGPFVAQPGVVVRLRKVEG